MMPHNILYCAHSLRVARRHSKGKFGQVTTVPVIQMKFCQVGGSTHSTKGSKSSFEELVHCDLGSEDDLICDLVKAITSNLHSVWQTVRLQCLLRGG